MDIEQLQESKDQQSQIQIQELLLEDKENIMNLPLSSIKNYQNQINSPQSSKIKELDNQSIAHSDYKINTLSIPIQKLLTPNQTLINTITTDEKGQLYNNNPDNIKNNICSSYIQGDSINNQEQFKELKNEIEFQNEQNVDQEQDSAQIQQLQECKQNQKPELTIELEAIITNSITNNINNIIYNEKDEIRLCEQRVIEDYTKFQQLINNRECLEINENYINKSSLQVHDEGFDKDYINNQLESESILKQNIKDNLSLIKQNQQLTLDEKIQELEKEVETQDSQLQKRECSLNDNNIQSQQIILNQNHENETNENEINKQKSTLLQHLKQQCNENIQNSQLINQIQTESILIELNDNTKFQFINKQEQQIEQQQYQQPNQQQDKDYNFQSQECILKSQIENNKIDKFLIQEEIAYQSEQHSSQDKYQEREDQKNPLQLTPSKINQQNYNEYPSGGSFGLSTPQNIIFENQQVNNDKLNSLKEEKSQIQDTDTLQRSVKKQIGEVAEELLNLQKSKKKDSIKIKSEILNFSKKSADYKEQVKIQKESILRKSICKLLGSANKKSNYSKSSPHLLKGKHSQSKSSIYKTPQRDQVSELKEKASLFKMDFSSFKTTPIDKFQAQTGNEQEAGNQPSSLTLEQRIDIALKELGLTTLRPIQNKILHRLLDQESLKSSKSVIAVMNQQSGKSTIYQLMCRLIPEMIVVVTNSHLHLPEKLKNIKNIISWASLNPFLSTDQKNKVLDLVASQQINLLYVSPDIFAQDTYIYFPNVGMLVFEEAETILDYSLIYRQSGFYQKIIKKLDPTRVLALTNLQPLYKITKLSEYFGISQQTEGFEENVPIREDNLYINFSNATFSKDEDKDKALCNFLRNSKLKIKSGILILCDNKKICEELTNYLNQSGFKAQNLMASRQHEYQRQELYQSFFKQNFDILVGISNYYFLKTMKSRIRCLIHYNVPRSLESYLQDLGGLLIYNQQQQPMQEGIISHTFISEADYHSIRNDLTSELVPKQQIEIILLKLFQPNNENKQDENIINSGFRKQNIDCEFLNIAPKDDGTNILQKVLQYSQIQQSQKISDDSNLIQQEQPTFFNNNDISLDDNDIKSIKINELCSEVGLSKEIFQKIVNILEEDHWLEQINIMPLICSLRISASIREETLLAQNNLIKQIIYNSKKFSGIYKFNMLDIANKLNITIIEIQKNLKKFQQDKILSYEMTEEALCIKLKQQPSLIELESKIEQIYQTIKIQHLNNIKAFDIINLAVRLCSYNTIEQVWKYAKYKDVSLQVKNKPFDKVPKVSSMLHSINNKKERELKKFIFSEFVNEYLTMDKIKQLDDIFRDYVEGGITVIRSKLPSIKIASQREKSGFCKDILNLLDISNINNQSEIMNQVEKIQQSSEQSDLSQQITPFQEARASQIVMILQGLNPKNGNLSEWRAHKLWSKYQKYDYFEMMETCIQVVKNIKHEFLVMETLNRKKGNKI